MWPVIASDVGGDVGALGSAAACVECLLWAGVPAEYAGAGALLFALLVRVGWDVYRDRKRKAQAAQEEVTNGA